MARANPNTQSLQSYILKIRELIHDQPNELRLLGYAQCMALEANTSLWKPTYTTFTTFLIKNRISVQQYTLYRLAVTYGNLSWIADLGLAAAGELGRIIDTTPALANGLNARRMYAFMKNAVARYRALRGLMPTIAWARDMAEKAAINQGVPVPPRKPRRSRADKALAVAIKGLSAIVQQGATTRPEYKIAVKTLEDIAVAAQ